MPSDSVPAVWMRGGTSKGLFFHAHDLPAEPAARERLLLAAIGSPDPFGGQIDGMGCATSSTSKVAIIGPPPDDSRDVSYLFGHVDTRRPLIDWSGSCGNLSAAVGLFALEQGLVVPDEPMTGVRVWQANLQRPMIVRVPTQDGRARADGDFVVAGVSRPGPRIDVDLLEPGGGPGGEALPTGNATDRLTVPGLGELSVSLVDAGNPTVFVRAQDLGLSGVELADRIEADRELMRRLELIRCLGAVAMELDSDPDRVHRERPATPKIAFVAPPRNARTRDGGTVAAGEADLVARILSMGRLHHAFTGTGSIAAAVAAAIPGTLVQDCLYEPLPPNRLLRLSHPAGVLEVGAQVVEREGQWIPLRATLPRTARTLMQGRVFV
jgi:2-methylaconitate isomerase